MRLVLWILSLLVGCVIAGCQGDRDVDNALLFCGYNAYQCDRIETVEEVMADLCG